MSFAFYYVGLEDQPLRYTIHKLSKMSGCGLACSRTHCDGALSNYTREITCSFTDGEKAAACLS